MSERNYRNLWGFLKTKPSKKEKEKEHESEEEKQEEEEYEERWVYPTPTRYPEIKDKPTSEQNYDKIEGTLIEENKIIIQYIRGTNEPLPWGILRLITTYFVLFWDETGVIGYSHPDYMNENPKPKKEKHYIPETPENWRGKFNTRGFPQYLYGGHVTREGDKIRSFLSQNEDKVTEKMLLGRLEFGFGRQLGVGNTAVYDITPERFQFLHSKVTGDIKVSRFCTNYRVRLRYKSEQLGIILFSTKFTPRFMQEVESAPGEYMVRVYYNGFTQKNWTIFKEKPILAEVPEGVVRFEHYRSYPITLDFKERGFFRVERPTVGVIRAHVGSATKYVSSQELDFTKYLQESDYDEKDVTVQFEMAYSGIYDFVGSYFSLAKGI